MTTRTLPILAVLAIAAGCATHPSYRDATEVRTLSRNFTHSDYEQTASAMIESLKSNPNFLANINEFKAAHSGERPKIVVSGIENRTRQMTLQLDVINDTIRTGIINTGLFRFVGNEKKVIKRKFDEENGVLVAPGASTGFSNQTGADYLLSGSLTELNDEGGRTKENVYILNMQLDNLATGETEWIDRKQIRKESKRAGLGW